MLEMGSHTSLGKVAMFILTKLDSKHDSAITSFDGYIHLVIYSIEDMVGQTIRDTLMLSHEVQKGPPHILNPFLRWFPCVAGSRPSSRLET